MPRRIHAVLAATCLAALALYACDSVADPGQIDPDAPALQIVDGRSNDSGVYLLPPIGESYAVSSFDARTPTRLEICTLTDGPEDLDAYTTADWEALEAASCIEDDPWLAYYGLEDSSDGTTFVTLQLDAYGNPLHYQLNLKTDPGMAYHAFLVSVSQLEIGSGPDGISATWAPKAWFHMAMFENSSASNVPGDWVGETAGQNFAVKWKAEWDGDDNFVAQVDCNGGLLDGTSAAAYVPEGFATECGAEPEFELILVQERVELQPGEVCLPVGWTHDGPCYRWQLYLFDGTTFERYNEQFETPLLVVYCLQSDEASADWSGWRAPYPYDALVYPTENTSAAGVFTPDCSELGPIAATGLTGFLHSLARLMGFDPQPLYAAHRGFGELTGGTSRFARVDAQEILIAAGDDQYGLVGGTLAEPLVARAVSVPHDDADVPEPRAGATVTFEVTGGSGFLTDGDGNTGTTLDVATDADGYAQVWWTLGTEVSPPDHTVDVYGDGFGFVVDNLFQTRRTYSATAIDVVTDFLEPLGDGSVTGPPHALFDPTVRICPYPAGASPCADAVVEYGAADIKMTETDGRKFFQVGWKPRDTGVAEGSFVVQVILSGNLVVGESVPILITKGGKDQLTVEGYLSKPTSDIPLKFTLSRVVP